MENKQTDNGTNKSDDQPVRRVTGEKEVPKVEASAEMVDIAFTGNRKFDLHVGREIKVFKARETKSVPKKWLEHPDFLQVKKYFVVKGIKK